MNRFESSSRTRKAVLLTFVFALAFAVLAGLAEGAVRLRQWIKHGDLVALHRGFDGLVHTRMIADPSCSGWSPPHELRSAPTGSPDGLTGGSIWATQCAAGRDSPVKPANDERGLCILDCLNQSQSL